MPIRCSLIGNPKAGDGDAVSRATHAFRATPALTMAGEPIDLLTAPNAAEAVRTALQDEPDIIAVAGGDGTIRAVAKAAMEAARYMPLVPLPGGTMNLLPRLIYGERTLEEAITALAMGRPGWLPGGLARGVAGTEPFLVAILFGYPSVAAQAREAVRTDGLAAAVTVAEAGADIYARSGEESLRLQLGDEQPTAASAFAASPYPLEILHGDLAAIEIPAAPRAFDVARISGAEPLARLRLAGTVVSGDWLDDPLVERRPARSLSVSGYGAQSALLDGEQISFDEQIDIRFEARLLKVLRPE